MKCNECNAINDSDAKFCHNCGAKLKEQPKPVKKSSSKRKKPLMDKNQVIFTVLGVIAIILAGALLSYSGALMPQPELRTQDFGAFAISVPTESTFVLEDQLTQTPGNFYVGYLNKGDWGYQIASISLYEKKDTNYLGELIESSGNRNITVETNGTFKIYMLYEERQDCELFLQGQNLELLKKMADSLEIKNLDLLRSNVTAVVPRI